MNFKCGLGVARSIKVAILILGSVTAPALCQDIFGNLPDFMPARGMYPSGSFTLGDIETVDNVTGNVQMKIPLAQLPPGRGGASFAVLATYNSAIYDEQFQTVNIGGTCSYGPCVGAGAMYQASPHGSWHYSFEYQIDEDIRPEMPSGGTCSITNVLYIYKPYLITPDGARHNLGVEGFTSSIDGYYQFSLTGTNQNGCSVPVLPDPLIYITTDGSYIRVEINRSTNATVIYLPDGGSVALGSAAAGGSSETITDRNGNTVYFTGTCADGGLCQGALSWDASPAENRNRNVRINYSFTGNSTVDSIEWPLPPGASTAPTTTVVWDGNDYVSYQYDSSHNLLQYLNYQDSQGKKAYFDINSINGGSIPKIHSITLPQVNGTAMAYTFGYANDNVNCPSSQQVNWGELHTMALPTGANVTYCYRYDPYVYPLSRPAGTSTNPIQKKVLQYSSTWDGSPSPVTETTSYGGFGASGSSTITDPDQSQTTYYFADNGNGVMGRLVAKIVDGVGNVTERAWGQNATAYAPLGAPCNPYIQAEIRTYENLKTNGRTSTIDQNGNTIATSEFDWLSSGSITRDGNNNLTGITATPYRITQNYYYASTPNAVSSSPTTNAYSYWQAASTGIATNLRAVKTTNLLCCNSSSPSAVAATSYIYDNWQTTANLTQELRWDSVLGSYTAGALVGSSIARTTNRTYAANGNLTSVTDPNGVESTIAYDSNNLYPTQIVQASSVPSGPVVARTTNYWFDFNSGALTHKQDYDNSVDWHYGYDALGRRTSVAESSSIGSRTAATLYNDANLTVTTTRDQLLLGDNSLQAVTSYDPLMRVRMTQTLGVNTPCGESSTITTETGYSAATRQTVTTNPYCSSSSSNSESTMGYTVTKSDAIGRVTEVDRYHGAPASSTAPWASNGSPNGVVTTGYGGSARTVTDEAGHQTVYTNDGLGRLASVIDSSSTTTSYGYNGMNALTSANVGGSQARSFSYSSLSRLLTATNPESGTINYTYDANGNMLTRRDQRLVGGTTPLQATITYDGMNRPLAKSYNDGTTPTVTYAYDRSSDTIGTLGSVSNSVSTTVYSHDKVGRVVSSRQTTSTTAYTPVSYIWSLSDALLSETYPSGRTIRYTYDQADHVKTVTGSLGGVTTSYTASGSSISYSPAGGIATLPLGNGLTETHGYNDRLQPTSISAGSWAINLYPCPGQAVHCSANNGNILEQDVTTPGVSGLKQTFGYDALNRLTAATEQNSGGPVTWTQSYSYDTYGNRWVSANSGVSLSPFTAVANSNFDAANHLYINGAGYDNTGNQTAIGGFANTFDAESRLTASTLNATTATYAYDGEGRRVQRIAGGATTQYVYDSQGNLVAEYSTQVPAVTGTEYLIADHLGSTRMTTDASGACLALHDYLPFGEEIPSGTGGRTGCYGSSDAVRQQFTGKERDSETGLDYFGARYMSSAQGRFTSPDPEGLGSVKNDPQSWNMYAYVRNNPLRYTDPDGFNYTVCDASGKNCRDLSDDQYKTYLSSIQGSSVSVSPGGNINYQNADGSVTKIGSASYYNERAENAAAFLNWGLGQMVINGALQGAGRAVGALFEAAVGYLKLGRAVGAVAEDVAASTPVGRRGAPLDVTPGTNAGTEIGNRWYSGHALDQMQGRGAVPSVVEDTIASGTKSPGNLPNTIKYSTSQADVVTNTQGNVVTVIVKSGK